MRSALGLLTILGGAASPTAQALRWFAPVGALVGGAVGGAWWLGARVWPVALAAVIAVVADLVLTGALHADGLVDSADGLLPPLGSPARRLEAMADPAVGAFGLAAGLSVLGLRVAGFAALVAPGREPSWAAVALVSGLWAASRAVVAAALLLVRPARPSGMAATFASPFAPPADPPADPPAGGGRARALDRTLVAAGFAVALALVAGAGFGGVAALAALTVSGAAVIVLGARRLGGITGDVLGASVLVGETIGLVVASARW